MEKFMEVVNYLMLNGPAILSAVLGLLSAIVVIALMIPGEQPEKSLKRIIEFLEKFSKK